MLLHELSEEERRPHLERHEAELGAAEARVAQYFDDNEADVLLLPAGKGPPPKCLTEAEYRAFPDQMAMLFQPGFLAHYSFGMQLTQLRIPSLALPTPARHALGPDGLDVPGPPPPAGVMLIGRPQDDVNLIRVARAIELALLREAK